MTDIVERLRDYDAEDEARNVLPPCGLIAEAAAEIESLRSRLAEYELLKRAVNESGDCLPDCDANTHNEQCPNVNNHVVMQDQRREIEALRDERALIVARAENAEAALVESDVLLGCCESTFDDLLNTLDHDEDCPWWDDHEQTPEAKNWSACGCWKRGVHIMRENVRELLSGQQSIDAYLSREQPRCSATLGNAGQCYKPEGHDGQHSLFDVSIPPWEQP